MSAEHLERLMQDARIIRHLGKLKSVPRNAQFILDVEQEKGSFGALIADWPVTDIVGLWTYLKKHGQSVGWAVGAALPAHGRQGHLRAEL
jgi:3-methyladenine DNA glycosylase Tag